MSSISSVLELLERCYVPKLSRNFEESENHPEFKKWETNLSEHFPTLMDLLNDLDPKEHGSLSSVLSSILLLYYQLDSKDKWNNNKCEECIKKLDIQLEVLYGITSCDNLLMSNKDTTTQELFDISIDVLHKKLNPDEFKMYPALIEAYCMIVKDIMYYDIEIKPVTVLPISLLLIEDYVNENRLKGLKSCLATLNCLTPEHFSDGNYYEVIYNVLKKLILESDLEVTKWVLDCLFILFQLLPSSVKVTTVDDTLGIILEQMYTETNLYRKKAFFRFINKIIHMHRLHCAKRTMFLTVICDNLDTCSNSGVAEILLSDTLECLENWVKYCWCVWKLSQNQKLMSTLIKMLYICHKEKDALAKMQTIFLTLYKLCTESEKKAIYNNIEKSIPEFKDLNEAFAERLEDIKSSMT
ncbi:TELO2-interacting protein 2-like [Ostrinia nubilalis]|uniref:TELO2-interacting protein 2-like n=1 Tax=Ostrinia nubilalis TaxID=29057 RepID=UPI0030825F54